MRRFSTIGSERSFVQLLEDKQHLLFIFPAIFYRIKVWSLEECAYTAKAKEWVLG